MVKLPGAKHKPSFRPYWRKPARKNMIKVWPPAKYMKEVEVDYGTFWSVARDHGRNNPWDVIIFNFGTEDHYEVNWYLHHAVGCWRSYDDINFDFEHCKLADGSKGKIYIPPPSWKPDPKFQKGSTSGVFLAGIRNIAASMLRELEPRVPTLIHGNTTVSGKDFVKVANLIETFKIDIVIDPEYGSENARYEALFRTITLGRMPRRQDIRMYGILANEATHAATHYKSREVFDFKTEAASFFVDAVSVAALDDDTLLKLLEKTSSGFDKLYFCGWVWLNYFKNFDIVELSDLDAMYPHPVHKVDKNPVAELKAHMYSIPDYRRKDQPDRKGNKPATLYEWSGDVL